MSAGSWWSRARQDVRGEPGLSVLLITIDTLRADAVGAYGRAGAITPWIDRLSASGVRFDQAHAQNVLTLPSHANILSGRYPLDHGVRDNSGYRFPAGQETLATLLKSRGYRTAAFVSAFPLDSRFGLDRGFDLYEDGFVDAEPRPAFLEEERRGTETIALARHWLALQNDHPFFCWVHVYEPHFPYDPPEALASQFRNDLYHGEVAAADAALGPLLEPILATGPTGRTLVVLTADHGESLGEHGEATHGIFAYEASLRVPLILYQPHLFGPRVVSEPARHVDLLPAIMDALSLPAPSGLPGRSLLPVIAGAPAAAVTTTYFEALSASQNRGWAPLHGIIRDRIKYIDLPIPELYDLGADPWETHNLAGSHPPLLQEMRMRLASLRSTDRGVVRTEETRETEQRLKALGYMAAGTNLARERYTEDDDPKRLIGLDAMLQQVVGLYMAGDLAGALTQCRALIRQRPRMPIALLHLAHLERESGDLVAAVGSLRQAVALNPRDTGAVALLGAYLTQAGRAREAVDLLEADARADDADLQVLVSRSLAQATLGRTEDALATLAHARQRDPSNAMLLVETGTVRLMGGRRDGARKDFAAALALNPNVARAHSSLAVMAAEEGHRDEAIAHWTQAVALDSREYGKLLAFAGVLSNSARPAAAQPYLELFASSAPQALYARDIERARAWLRLSH